MYVLTLFYRHGSQVRFTNEDPLVLEYLVGCSDYDGQIYAWRVVNQLSGKCCNYWKEHEKDGERAYQL